MEIKRFFIYLFYLFHSKLRAPLTLLVVSTSELDHLTTTTDDSDILTLLSHLHTLVIRLNTSGFMLLHCFTVFKLVLARTPLTHFSFGGFDKVSQQKARVVELM